MGDDGGGYPESGGRSCGPRGLCSHSGREVFEFCDMEVETSSLKLSSVATDPFLLLAIELPGVSKASWRHG